METLIGTYRARFRGTADMAKELRPHNVAAVSIWMNILDTERARTYFETLLESQRPNYKLESSQFTGRVSASLYASGQMMELSGRALIGAELSAALKVTDIGEGKPVSHRYAIGGHVSSESANSRRLSTPRR